jgi:hypothetical protein
LFSQGSFDKLPSKDIVMTKKPLRGEKSGPLDIDKDWPEVQNRIASEIAEIGARGSGIAYHDPAFGDRLVREYPDGRKFFLIEIEPGKFREVAVEIPAKAA